MTVQALWSATETLMVPAIETLMVSCCTAIKRAFVRIYSYYKNENFQLHVLNEHASATGRTDIPESITLLQESAHFFSFLIDGWLWSDDSAVLIMHGSILNDLHSHAVVPPEKPVRTAACRF